MSACLGRSVDSDDLSRPFEELGLDSLDLVLLLLEAESQGVDLPEALVDELRNLDDLAHYVLKHRSNQPTQPHATTEASR